MILKPHKRRCRLVNCRPGLFLFDGELCLRTEYGVDSYIVSTGEAFWGGTGSHEARGRLWVLPVDVVNA